MVGAGWDSGGLRVSGIDNGAAAPSSRAHLLPLPGCPRQLLQHRAHLLPLPGCPRQLLQKGLPGGSLQAAGAGVRRPLAVGSGRSWQRLTCPQPPACPPQAGVVPCKQPAQALGCGFGSGCRSSAGTTAHLTAAHRGRSSLQRLQRGCACRGSLQAAGAGVRRRVHWQRAEAGPLAAGGAEDLSCGTNGHRSHLPPARLRPRLQRRPCLQSFPGSLQAAGAGVRWRVRWQRRRLRAPTVSARPTDTSYGVSRGFHRYRCCC